MLKYIIKKSKVFYFWCLGSLQETSSQMNLFIHHFCSTELYLSNVSDTVFCYFMTFFLPL